MPVDCRIRVPSSVHDLAHVMSGLRLDADGAVLGADALMVTYLLKDRAEALPGAVMKVRNVFMQPLRNSFAVPSRAMASLVLFGTISSRACLHPFVSIMLKNVFLILHANGIFSKGEQGQL